MTETATAFDIGAGELCLDLINTLNGRATPSPREQLTDYDAVLRLAGQGEALTPERTAQLRAAALRDAVQANALAARTRAFREALYGVFEAVLHGWAVQADDLRLVNDEVRGAMARVELIPAPDRFRWTVGAATPDLAEPLWMFARSAFELLLSPDLGRVRVCANHECGWLFLDLSRNRSRKWCDMSSCGNRAKVRRFREREAHA